jgi:hypothetical protein
VCVCCANTKKPPSVIDRMRYSRAASTHLDNVLCHWNRNVVTRCKDNHVKLDLLIVNEPNNITVDLADIRICHDCTKIEPTKHNASTSAIVELGHWIEPLCTVTVAGAVATHTLAQSDVLQQVARHRHWMLEQRIVGLLQTVRRVRSTNKVHADSNQQLLCPVRQPVLKDFGGRNAQDDAWQKPIATSQTDRCRTALLRCSNDNIACRIATTNNQHPLAVKDLRLLVLMTITSWRHRSFGPIDYVVSIVAAVACW